MKHIEGASAGDKLDGTGGADRFVHRIKVRWADCDPARIAYTGRIPAFALEAIDAWWEHHIAVDWFRLNVDRNIGTPFVHLDVDLRLPVTPRAPLYCEVRLARLGRKSVTFHIRGLQTESVRFEGTFVSAFVVADTFRTIEVPEDIRRAIEPLLDEAQRTASS